MTLATCEYQTPFGRIGIVAMKATQAISLIIFDNEKPGNLNIDAFLASSGTSLTNSPILTETVKQLDEYFIGRRKYFNLPQSPYGSLFQRTVWNELNKIPYGQTISYADLACRVGKPQAFRAVGTANKKNRLPIIVPCHRVIGSDGRSHGYAGGLEVQEYLLRLEQSNGGN